MRYRSLSSSPPIELSMNHENSFPKYTHFIESQQMYLNHLQNQLALSEGYEASGIRLLCYILSCADIPNLLTYTNNYN